MLEGAFVENVFMHSETRAYPQYPTITAGVIDGTQAIYRYSLRESSYPTLIIVDTLTDGQGNYIYPGHYELALSDERDFFILIESKKPIAIFPVFKVEVEISEKPQIHDRKSLKKQQKKNKEIIKTNKKREKVGQPPVDTDEDIYQNAQMEYIPSGKYYLIKYERADIRAWGAIKE